MFLHARSPALTIQPGSLTCLIVVGRRVLDGPVFECMAVMIGAQQTRMHASFPTSAGGEAVAAVLTRAALCTCDVLRASTALLA